MYKPALIAGALCAAIAVMLGAMGAHALKPRLTPEMLAAFRTGAEYQFYHSLALLATGICYQSFPFALVRRAAILFMLGIACFSGSLYLIAFLSMSGSSLGPIGIVTPIGGVLFIAGWLMLLAGFAKKK